MFAAHHSLDNLCAFVDYNKLQSDDQNSNIIGLEPLVQKWTAFGWNVMEIDGHLNSEISEALKNANGTVDKPSMIIAHTVKGKGVSFMENVPSWHGSVKMTPEDLTSALVELGADDLEIERALNG